MTPLPADVPLSSLLPTDWARAVESSPSWSDAAALAEQPGSASWWEAVTQWFPAHAVISACARREELARSLQVIPSGSRVLDLACGPGVTTSLLVELGAGSVVGVDISPAMIAAAERGSAVAGVEFVCADVTAPLPWADGSFDAAVLGDFYDPYALDEARRLVRPGGVITARMTDVVPPLIYSFDPWFNARVTAAYLHGESESFGGAGPRQSWSARVQRDGFGSLHTVAVERSGGLDRLSAAFVLTTELFWRLGNAWRFLADDDRDRLRRLWDPESPDALLRSPDAHLVQHLSIAHLIT